MSGINKQFLRLHPRVFADPNLGLTFAGNNTHTGNNTFSGVNTFTGNLLWAQGADIASATTVVVGTDGNYFDITGNTGPIGTITVSAGNLFIFQFDSTPTLTHHATNLDLPGEKDIVVEAGDSLMGYATADNQVHVVSFTRASGKAVVRAVLGTPQATTSGTTFDFTISPGADRITMMLDGCSLSGSDEFLVQIGDAGGFETSGYSGGVRDGGGSVSNGSGFLLIVAGSSGNAYDGVVVLTRMDGNKWAINGHVGEEDMTGSFHQVIGNKTLSAELTQIKLTRTGSDTFDLGSVNVLEG